MSHSPSTSQERQFLAFRITDIERAFHLHPGSFGDLPEHVQWRLLDYHELMTSDSASLGGVHPSLLSISPLTASAMLQALRPILQGLSSRSGPQRSGPPRDTSSPHAIRNVISGGTMPSDVATAMFGSVEVKPRVFQGRR